MSFDIDPKDKYERFLLYHPESDCLYEVFSVAEKEYCISSDGFSIDITGDEKAEERFRLEGK